jgi:hypothetical protein
VEPNYSMGKLELPAPARLTPPRPGIEVTLILKIAHCRLSVP